MARLGAGRLAHNRWTLAAGIVSILAVFLVADGSWLFVAAAIAAMVIVSALAPRRTRSQRKADEAVAGDRPGLVRLSAEAPAQRR